MLSEDDHRRIEQAVRAAEAVTTGEIACIMAHEVSKYRETPLAWASAVALLVPPIALLLGVHPLAVAPWLLDWNGSQGGAADALLSRTLESYAVLQVALFAVVAGVVAIPSVRRLLTPSTLKKHRVHQVALQQFLATGLHANADRTGVVIFASQLDRRVEILADDAIHQAVGDRLWNAAVAEVQKGMKSGDPASGFVRGIQICGGALAEHFPATGPHENSLSDRLLEL